MKHVIQIIMIIAVAAGTILVVITQAGSGSSVSVQPASVTQQPQRERYQPPEWVVNERGQRCIRQGTTVTCG
jgi:hypothetical protein